MNKSTITAAVGVGIFVILITAGIVINQYHEALGLVARAVGPYTAFLVRDNMVGGNNFVYAIDTATGASASRAFNDPRFIEMDPTNPNQLYVLERTNFQSFPQSNYYYRFVVLGLPNLNIVNTVPWTQVVIPWEEGTFTIYPLDMEITPDGNNMVIAFYEDTATTGSPTIVRRIGTVFFNLQPGPQYGGWVRYSPVFPFTISSTNVPSMGIAITPDSTTVDVFGSSGNSNVLWNFARFFLQYPQPSFGYYPNGNISIPGVSQFYGIQADNNKAYVYYFDASQPVSSRLQSISIANNSTFLAFLTNLSILATPKMRHDLELNASQNRLVASGQGSTIVNTTNDTIVCTEATNGADSYQSEFYGPARIAALHSTPAAMGTSNGTLGLVNTSNCGLGQSAGLLGNLSYPGFGTLPIIPPPWISAPLVNGILSADGNYFYSTAAGTPAGVAVYSVNLNTFVPGNPATQLFSVLSPTAYVVDMDTTNVAPYQTNGNSLNRRDATY